MWTTHVCARPPVRLHAHVILNLGSQPHHLQLELSRALVLGLLLSHVHGAQIRHVRQNDEVDRDQDNTQDLVVVLEIRRQHNERTDERKHDLILSGKRQHVGLESLVGEPLPVEHAVEDRQQAADSGSNDRRRDELQVVGGGGVGRPRWYYQ